MRKNKSLPKLETCPECESLAVHVGRIVGKREWMFCGQCLEYKCLYWGPFRKTERGAIIAWNNEPRRK